MSTIVNATIDLKSLGWSKEQWIAFIGDNPWEYVKQQPRYDNKMRNLLEGWQRYSSVREFSETRAYEDGLYKPCCYALVAEKDYNPCHPILDKNTILFGETTQSAAKRLYTHTAAMKGRTSNMTNKYENHSGWIERKTGVNVFKDLDKIGIYYRFHDLTDKHFQYERYHSSLMETQCHALYKVLHDEFAPGNNRDLPTYGQIDQAKEFLVEKNLITN